MSAHQQIDRSRPMAGSYIFDGAASRKGYSVNRFCMSLADAANREEFKRDEGAYMDRFGLTEQVKALVAERDFLGLIKAGANIYMLIKLGAAVGEGLYHMGAQQRGETYEAFLATRNASGAR